MRKNVPQLLRAFAQLEPNDVKLVIAGKLPAQDSAFSPDPRRVARELGIEERVQFTGWVDESDKPSLYGQAIALVFPSSYEGFGLPPLEALASGTPAIVSSAGSLPEVVGPGGLCVDVGEPAALTEAMHRLCTDSSLRARLQRAGLEHAQRFGWDRVTEATMSACIEVTGKNGLGMVQPRAEEASR